MERGGNAVYLLENNSHLTDLLNVECFPLTLSSPSVLSSVFPLQYSNVIFVA